MLLSELETLLETVERDPRKHFGDDVDDVLRDLRIKAYPDHFPDAEKARVNAICQRFAELADIARAPAVTITIKGNAYSLGRLLASGDASDIYETADGMCAVKVSRVPGVHELMRNEYEILNGFLGNDFILKYVPHVVSSMRGKDSFLKQITVFKRDPSVEYYTLAQVAQKYPAGLDGRHLAWIFKRLLECLGAVHKQGIVHTAILPEHVLVFPRNHGISLIDWKTATKPGSTVTSISVARRNFYAPEILNRQPVGEATDIFMAAGCIMWLGCGNLLLKDATSVPRQMLAFLRSCMLEKYSMRPTDAWALHQEFSDMLLGLYGKPRFVELTM